MEPRTLGCRTDLIFHRFEGVVRDRGDYLLIRTPSNPTYHWGNFLLFAEAPEAGDLARWTALSKEEIGEPEKVGHLVFGWDSVERGELEPFLKAGFELEQSLVMMAERVKPPPKLNPEVETRSLESDADFEAAIELQGLLGLEDNFEPEGYRIFRERKMAGYRSMIRAGRGCWFGAFLDGRLVGDMGLFWDGDLGRFQAVSTHPDYRRRGIAGTLLSFVGGYGLAQAGLERLVIVADDAYFAKDLYHALGFEIAERQWGVGWHAGLGALGLTPS